MNRFRRFLSAFLLASTCLPSFAGVAAAQWSAGTNGQAPQGYLQPPSPAAYYAPNRYFYNGDPYYERYGYPGGLPRYGLNDYYYRPDYAPYRFATPRQLEDYDNRAEKLSGLSRYRAERDQPPIDEKRIARIQVVLPSPAAQLWIEGEKSAQTGQKRNFRSPPLENGKTYFYTIMAAWPKDGKLITEEREVEVSAGEQTIVNFTAPAGPLKAPSIPNDDEPTSPSIPNGFRD